MSDKLQKVKEQPWAANKALIEFLESLEQRIEQLELEASFKVSLGHSSQRKGRNEKKEKENKVSA